jgi:hypothetical protein
MSTGTLSASSWNWSARARADTSAWWLSVTSCSTQTWQPRPSSQSAVTSSQASPQRGLSLRGTRTLKRKSARVASCAASALPDSGFSRAGSDASTVARPR